MKFIISEKQYGKLIEQSDFAMDRRLGIEDKNTKTLDMTKKEYIAKVGSFPWSHELATALSMGAAFIPIVGPAISALIGVADALEYSRKGDNQTAGMVAMFSLLPGAGKLATKIPGIKQLGQKGMVALGAKLANKTPQLSSVEQQVLKGISQNSQLVKQEVSQIVTDKAKLALKNPSLSKSVKSTLTTLVKNTPKVEEVVFNPKLLPMTAEPISKNLLPAVISQTKQLSSLQTVVFGNNSKLLLNKMGIKPGTTIKTSIGNFNFGDIVDAEYVIINTKKTKIWDFLKNYLLKPSTILNTLSIPLTIRELLKSINPNGTINQKELESLPSISPQQLQKDMDFLSQSVATYQGSKGVYTSDRWVEKYQTALSMLGYKLPISCRGGKCDGKFGPETKKAIESFQTANGLTSSLGKMDRITARKLAEVLKTKNIQGSKSIQMSMNAA